MSKRKKVNPRRRPATAADVKKAKEQAQSFALDAAWAIFFTALRDKEGFGEKRLRRVWDEVNAISDSIQREYITVADLRRALKEEAGIVFGEGERE